MSAEDSMNNRPLPTAPGSSELRAKRRVSTLLILAALGTFCIVGCIAVSFHDWNLLWTMGTASVLLAVPSVLLRCGKLRAGNLVLMAIALATVTAAATLGQGIRDIAIIALPIVLVFAGMTLDRAMLGLCGGLTLVAVAWLAFGERFGWFAPVPISPDPLNLSAFALAGVLLLVATLAVDLLASNTRKTLALARMESARRQAAVEELSESNALFSEFVSHSPVYAFIKEVTPTESRIVKASENFKDMTGIPGNEMVGKTMVELFPSGLAAKMTSDDWAVIADEKVLEFDEDLNGRSYHTIKFPVPQKGKNYLAGYTMDVTERNRTQEALRRSESQFRALIEQAPVAIGVFSLDGATQYGNRRFYELLGLESVSAAKGKLAYTYFAPQFREQSRERTRRQLAGLPVPEEYESVAMRPDGSEFPVHLAISTVQGADTKVSIAFLTDISPRVKAEQALRESYEGFKILFEGHSSVMLVIDPTTGAIRDANTAAAVFYGWSIDELRTKRIQEINTAPREVVETALQKASSSGHINTEFRHRLADGSLRDVEVFTTRVEIRGSPVLYSVIHDITKRKDMEKELEEHRQRLETLVAERTKEIQLLSQLTFVSLESASVGAWWINFEEDDTYHALDTVATMIGLPLSRSPDKAYRISEWVNVLRATKVKAPEYAEIVDRALEQFTGTIAGRYQEYRTVYPVVLTGQPVKWIDARADVSSRGSDGKALTMTGTLIDVTKLVTVERELKAHQAHLEQEVEERTTELALRNRELQAASERLVLATRAANIGIWDWDIVHDELVWDDAMYRLYGIRREDFSGAFSAWSRIIHPDDKERAENAIQAALRGEREYELEFRVVWPNGTIHSIQSASTTFRTSDGKPIRMVGINYDTTERKRTEIELHENEEKFRSAFMTSMDAFYIATLEDGLIVEVNDNFEKVFGYPREEVVGKTSLELGLYYDPTDRPRMVAELKATGRVRDLELQARKKGGEIRTISISISILFLNNRKHILGIVRDISERKQEEKRLLDSETRFRALSESAIAGVYIVQDGVMSYVNPALARIFGFQQNELVGADPLIVIHPDDRALVRENIRRRIVGEVNSLQYEFHGLCKDGTVKDIEVMGAGVVINGRPAIVGNILDITERKQAEEAKAKLEAQLMQAQKMESIGRLAGGVAHDFNNMLQVIRSHLELLLKDPGVTDAQRNNLVQIREAARRSADLTNRLLAFSRSQEISPRLIDLNETVQKALKMLHRLIGEDIDLVWKPGNLKGSVKADPAQLDQVLANLAVNARDAILGVGTLSLETAEATLDDAYCRTHPECTPGRYVLLTVSDNGAGMSPEVQARAFEPFFTTKPVGKGTGLGLPSVYGVIKQNGGHLTLRSEPGHGTSVGIYLPLIVGARNPEDDNAPGDEQPRGGNETILIVEDEEAILEVSQLILAELGYHVLGAATPEAAVQVAERHPRGIDLLVTDVIMPRMNGRELSRRIAARQPGMKCLYVSGYTADTIGQHGVLEKGVHFLAKPFSTYQLAAKIRQVLEGSEDG